MRTSKYQQLMKKKAAHCRNKVKKSAVRQAANDYIRDAVKKGNKTRAQAQRSANRIVNKSCPTTVKKSSRSTRKIGQRSRGGNRNSRQVRGAKK